MQQDAPYWSKISNQYLNQSEIRRLSDFREELDKCYLLTDKLFIGVTEPPE